MDCMGGVYQTLNQRRGEIVEDNQIAGTPLSEVQFYIIFRLKLIFLYLNPSVSLEPLEETLKEKPSHKTFSTIGLKLKACLLKMPNLKN